MLHCLPAKQTRQQQLQLRLYTDETADICLFATNGKVLAVVHDQTKHVGMSVEAGARSAGSKTYGDHWQSHMRCRTSVEQELLQEAAADAISVRSLMSLACGTCTMDCRRQLDLTLEVRTQAQPSK